MLCACAGCVLVGTLCVYVRACERACVRVRACARARACVCVCLLSVCVSEAYFY